MVLQSKITRSHTTGFLIDVKKALCFCSSSCRRCDLPTTSVATDALSRKSLINHESRSCKDKWDGAAGRFSLAAEDDCRINGTNQSIEALLEHDRQEHRERSSSLTGPIYCHLLITLGFLRDLIKSSINGEDEIESATSQCAGNKSHCHSGIRSLSNNATLFSTSKCYRCSQGDYLWLPMQHTA